MEAAEYDLEFFHRNGFHRRVCSNCQHPFWSLGGWDRCQEEPCTPYGHLGRPGFARPQSASEMRETFLRFFEQRNHTRIRRYPVVARWRNDVFFTQASIYDFQPWVTSGEIPPPANPLAISQPCVRFVDLEEVGPSARHMTAFEMMAHHAFNRPDHTVYFKDRCAELCHEFLTSELGADPTRISYKEEEWEGGGNLGPSLSVGLLGVELATLVFMEYVRDGSRLKPMPLTVVDTGYGLERFTWMSQGTRTAHEAVYGESLEELRRSFSPKDAVILVDHARALNFVLTDGVVPSNTQEGYYARLLLRRSLRILARAPEAPSIGAVLDRVGRDLARDFPEIGEHREDLHRVVDAEVERFDEAIRRARDQIRRHEERVVRGGGTVGVEALVEWYDSLGITPDVAVEELRQPVPVPDDFYARVAARHASERPETEYSDHPNGIPEVPAGIPPTEVQYYLDPYTLSFRGHILWNEGPWVVLDRTYFYPTGGGQLADAGSLGDVPVVDVARRGPWVLHRLERDGAFRPGTEVHGKIAGPRRRQLMQHHTATHLLNGALREQLGRHVWQTGAHKGTDSARIDVTHFRALTADELRRVHHRVQEIIAENRPVRSYFEPRSEAERRFGFTLYQGGAVPGRDLRIVEIPDFDVEACGGTHCTHTSEVGSVVILGTERIHDGVVRVTYAAGERALEVQELRERILRDSGQKLGVPLEQIPEGIERLQWELSEARRAIRIGGKADLAKLSEELLETATAVTRAGGVEIVHAEVDLDRDELKELSRRITRRPGRVAILGATREGKGVLFVGSSSETVPARSVLEATLTEFSGKGGGNANAATAEGEPGEPLRRALRAAIETARATAESGPGRSADG